MTEDEEEEDEHYTFVHSRSGRLFCCQEIHLKIISHKKVATAD